MNSVIDGVNLWKYKQKLHSQKQAPESLKTSLKLPEVAEMSVCAEHDRLSEVLGGQKIEDVAYQNSRSTAEDDPVMQIHEKSRKLREKQAKYTAKQNSKLINSRPNPPCQLRDSDWRDLIS